MGYTPISGAALPFFIAVEEKLFQKHGFEVSSGIFMGGSPLINSARPAGEFPIGYTGGGAIISSRLAGSDLIAIASPLSVLTIDAWAKPKIKSIADLRGKRVGVTRFGASTYFAGSFDVGVGLESNRARLRLSKMAVSASRSRPSSGGRVDVCMIGYPFGLRAKNAGLSVALPAVDDRIRTISNGRHRGARLVVEGCQEPQGGGGFFARARRRSAIWPEKTPSVTKKALRNFTRVNDDADSARQLRVLQGRFPPNAESRWRRRWRTR